MSKREIQAYVHGIALAQDWAKLQLWNSAAMLMSAILAYSFVMSMPIVVDCLAFATAAATAFTVGVCCSPSTYRTRSGSLSMAISLMAFMWAIPLV